MRIKENRRDAKYRDLYYDMLNIGYEAWTVEKRSTEHFVVNY